MCQSLHLACIVAQWDEIEVAFSSMLVSKEGNMVIISLPYLCVGTKQLL